MKSHFVHELEWAQMARQTKARLLPACLGHCWSLSVFMAREYGWNVKQSLLIHRKRSQHRSLVHLIALCQNHAKPKSNLFCSRCRITCLRLLFVRMQAACVRLCTNPNYLGKAAKKTDFSLLLVNNNKYCENLDMSAKTRNLLNSQVLARAVLCFIPEIISDVSCKHTK